MNAYWIHQLPIVDPDGAVVGLVTRDMLMSGTRQRDNWVVLMAGGRGTRLRPLTETTPKPMLKVGSRPILESIIRRYLEAGFYRFLISVNYRAEQIKDFFGDGGRWNCEIRYLDEPDALGTAGALGLLPERPADPFFVMNGDVLTAVNFQSLLDFHLSTGSAATMCVREYDLTIPFGVVQVDHHRILGIEEKPSHKFFINAGIYVLDPAALAFVAPGRHLDMPSLFQALIRAGHPANAFPIREYWMDVGRMEDFVRAQEEFCTTFG
jgi:NDP-sugar pyrophosphorylase family protein